MQNPNPPAPPACSPLLQGPLTSAAQGGPQRNAKQSLTATPNHRQELGISGLVKVCLLLLSVSVVQICWRTGRQE